MYRGSRRMASSLDEIGVVQRKWPTDIGTRESRDEREYPENRQGNREGGTKKREL
jgi:hypothetical protein